MTKALLALAAIAWVTLCLALLFVAFMLNPDTVLDLRLFRATLLWAVYVTFTPAATLFLLLRLLY